MSRQNTVVLCYEDNQFSDVTDSGENNNDTFVGKRFKFCY